LLEDWSRSNAANGSKLRVEHKRLKRRVEGRLRTTSGVGA